jgi:ribosome-associated protein
LHARNGLVPRAVCDTRSFGGMGQAGVAWVGILGQLARPRKGRKMFVTDAIAIPDTEFAWSYARSGGPGGQNVNKVSSKAVLRWAVLISPSLPPHVRDRLIALNRRRVTVEGDLVLNSQRYRDQDRNRQDCLEKLAALIREAATLPKARRATRPTRGSKKRRLAAKRHRSALKASRRDGIEE